MFRITYFESVPIFDRAFVWPNSGVPDAGQYRESPKGANIVSMHEWPKRHRTKLMIREY